MSSLKSITAMDLVEIMKTTESINDILQDIICKTAASTQSARANAFEKLWDIHIKFGILCELWPNAEYTHYIGNINTCDIKPLKNLENYLQNTKVFSRNAGGSSDIILQNNRTKKWIFISCKFYLNDANKQIDDYDVEKIMAVSAEHSHKFENRSIYLLVNNKKCVQAIIDASRKTSKYIAKNICGILDVTDLKRYFVEFRREILNSSSSEINSRFCNNKIPINLRFHQRLIVDKIMESVECGETQLLLGAKARSGKTYCIGGLFVEYYRKYGNINALVVTPAPTETLSQFTDDLFHKFRDFIGINIIEIKTSKGVKQFIDDESRCNNNIIIVSKQLLDSYTGKKCVTSIKELVLDFIVFDENHFHGTTQMSKEIIMSYSSPKTIKLYLTATFAKPLLEWKIPENCRIYWDIEDEQMCKARNITDLVKKHGEIVYKYIPSNSTHEFIEQMLQIYNKMPDLHIISNLFHEEWFIKIIERVNDTSYGFSWLTLLSGNFAGEVDLILQYLSGSNKERDWMTGGDQSPFGRIRKISADKGSRTNLNNADFTTQIWFLPFGVNTPLTLVSEHLQERMLKNPILSRYEIKIVNSSKKYKQLKIKTDIANWELKAKKSGKLGLILLAGNQLTLGITLPMVDIVFLFNDTTSSDRVVQMTYRCMTERLNCEETDRINSGLKKIGFVIDLNPWRVLNTILDVNIHKKRLNPEDHIRYVIENNLINLDADMSKIFVGTENTSNVIERLMKLWKKNPINFIDRLNAKLKENPFILNKQDQEIVNYLFGGASVETKQNINLKIKMDEDSHSALQTGRVITPEKYNNKTDNCDENDEPDEKVQEPQKDISFTEKIPDIALLVVVLTVRLKPKDIIDAIEHIKHSPYLLDAFNEQTQIWWNKDNIIEQLELLLKRNLSLDENSETNYIIVNIFIQLTMSFESLIDKPQELLEYIEQHLKPKHIEKKQFGEVFTPMSLVNEMLDKLPEDIWINASLKWLDPASGMGNYSIAVYLRLMESLKPQIKDISLRKKHILENMLYMCELNKKNVTICKQIFNISGEYSLNLYEGDSLALNYEKEFGFQKFDIIMGNPPYQDNSGNKGKGHTLWTRFVELSINKLLNINGYLVFVHPSLWRQPEHQMLYLLKEKQILYLEIHDEKDGQKTFKCSTRYDWYILHNTDYTKNTQIKGQDNKIYNIDLRSWSFIPNYDFDIIHKLLAIDTEPINILYSRSDYASDKKWTSKIKQNEYIYDVAYSVNRKNDIKLIYSNINNKGHYTIPKLIFGSGATGFYIDIEGNYALSEFCTGIIDKPENLQKIKEAFENNKFISIIKAISVSKSEINRKILKYLKKDFYLEFSDNIHT